MSTTTSVEWFQTLLSSIEAQSSESIGSPGASSSGSEFLRIHTYLTQRIDIDTAQNIVLNSVGAAVDPLTELKSRTNFGRPPNHISRPPNSLPSPLCNRETDLAAPQRVCGASPSFPLLL
ncbi:hypothetical protein IFR05_016576 [Cadophora sp. M221]|nr:hypothetical protein IFR05_016576 [Cadophora sp. M221]